jgi:hypothetical protein
MSCAFARWKPRFTFRSSGTPLLVWARADFSTLTAPRGVVSHDCVRRATRADRRVALPRAGDIDVAREFDAANTGIASG